MHNCPPPVDSRWRCTCCNSVLRIIAVSVEVIGQKMLVTYRDETDGRLWTETLESWIQDEHQLRRLPDNAKTLEEKMRLMFDVLERIEHVTLPGMSFARCPICQSPNDPSEPHEIGCELAELIKQLAEP